MTDLLGRLALRALGQPPGPQVRIAPRYGLREEAEVLPDPAGPGRLESEPRDGRTKNVPPSPKRWSVEAVPPPEHVERAPIGAESTAATTATPRSESGPQPAPPEDRRPRAAAELSVESPTPPAPLQHDRPSPEPTDRQASTGTAREAVPERPRPEPVRAVATDSVWSEPARADAVEPAMAAAPTRHLEPHLEPPLRDVPREAGAELVVLRPRQARYDATAGGRRSEPVPAQPTIPASAAASEPVVNVTIGRVEVQAIHPPAPPARERPDTRLSLDRYLRGREGDR